MSTSAVAVHVALCNFAGSCDLHQAPGSMTCSQPRISKILCSILIIAGPPEPREPLAGKDVKCLQLQLETGPVAVIVGAGFGPRSLVGSAARFSTANKQIASPRLVGSLSRLSQACVRGFGGPANQDRRWRLREWRALKLSVLSRAASESRVKCLLLCPGGGKDWKRLRMISD